MEQIWNQIVAGTKTYLNENGFHKVLLGMSGGIDSSVVACIGATAVGPENVMGVMMPSPFSSDGSITDSAQLAENWGFETLTIPIAPLMGSFDTALRDVFAGHPRDATEENIQARIRGVLLMALSNKFGSLLLNTCNKSEDYVGYCTLYGDSCGGIAPLGALYKTDVYKLARWINDNPELPNIPAAVLTKPPSAELSEGQKDTDQLPPYDALDPILKLLVDEKVDIQRVVNQGYDAGLVKKVAHMIAASAFKREQSPPAVPISG